MTAHNPSAHVASAPVDYSARRRELEDRLAIEHLEVQVQQLQTARAGIALESWNVDGQEFVDRRDYLPTGFGFDVYGRAGAPYSDINDRRDGQNAPFIENEQDLALIRGVARVACGMQPPAIAIQKNLTNYVIGTGFEFTASPRKSSEIPAEVVAFVQDIIEEFCEENAWHNDYDRELFWRSERDGEAYLALYPTRDGHTKARTIEPEQNTESAAVDDATLARHGVDQTFAKEWRFGVCTDEHDVQNIHGYGVRWDATSSADFVSVRYVEHYKANVDRNVKRGLSSFYAAWKWLLKQEKLLRNTADGSALQAAIAWMVQHAPGVSQTGVETMRRDAANRSYTRRGANGNTETVNTDHFGSATILDYGGGATVQPGPLGSERSPNFLGVSQALLRFVGSMWCMPEFMISGDASNGNYASILESGTPFEQNAKHMQKRFGGFSVRVLWKVVQNAIDGGRFDKFGKWADVQELKRGIEIQVGYPDPRPDDPLPKTQRRAILTQAGVMSRRTWQIEEGLNPEEENESGLDNPAGEVGSDTGSDPSDVTSSEFYNRDELKSGGDADAAADMGGEFGGLSRQQLVRNRKAINDVLADVKAGDVSIVRAKEELAMLGVSAERALRLVDDAAGSVAGESGWNPTRTTAIAAALESVQSTDEAIAILESFSESDHPRDSDGKFSRSGGKSSRKKSDTKKGSPEGDSDSSSKPVSSASGKSTAAKKKGVSAKAAKNAVEDYSTDQFQRVNGGLRSGKIDGNDRVVKGVDQYLKTAPKREGATIRSFSTSGEETQKIKSMLEGGTFTDSAFISTRKSPTLTDRAAFLSKQSEPGRVVLKVQGKNGVDISALSLNSGEGEVLYPRGTKFRVDKWEELPSGGLVAILTEK